MAREQSESARFARLPRGAGRSRRTPGRSDNSARPSAIQPPTTIDQSLTEFRKPGLRRAHFRREILRENAEPRRRAGRFSLCLYDSRCSSVVARFGADADEILPPRFREKEPQPAIGEQKAVHRLARFIGTAGVMPNVVRYAPCRLATKVFQNGWIVGQPSLKHGP